ncbi:unnamed protein product [Cyprideis torosa]|uniref:Uncharacterized protein n=1 Tax=Cyprideis torosa TaxID=163714 RepID=A0A7R8WBX0_9CRUS|nr:unnamed protein product [Cyprideis torosa]CAG0891365.1 unnamed protein product [Cyprideis torosa]
MLLGPSYELGMSRPSSGVSTGRDDDKRSAATSAVNPGDNQTTFLKEAETGETYSQAKASSDLLF